MLRILSPFLICSTLALAQEGGVPDTTASALKQEAVLPQANSDEARALVSKALDKTAAYARGTFTTSESQDNAMFRRAGLPIGAQDVEVQGGWDRHLIWGEWDGRNYMAANGRMLAKIDGKWCLRRNKLSSGVKAPFTVDPEYLVTVLKQLPKVVSNVVNVEAGTLRGKAMALLTIKLHNEYALDFSDSGAVPDSGGGFGGVMLFGGMGGVEPPRPEVQTYVVFYVDAENGDLARLAVKTYSKDESMGQIRIAAAGAGFGGNEEEEVEEEEVASTSEVKWKRGFPNIKPANDESVMTFQADFKKLGLAQAPELDDVSKALLRVR